MEGLIFPRELLYRGAEADVYKGVWSGRDAVFKVRKRLSYRLPQLDNVIRGRRTMREAQMLHRAKSAGVASPHLFFVDTVNHSLVMEFVPGMRLKEVLSVASEVPPSILFEELGRGVARLHAAGLVHGDLTTANVITDARRLVLVDFGLANLTSKLEDRAVDLRLLKETVTGAHPDMSVIAFDSFMDGYGQVLGKVESLTALKQLRRIERRGRYANVE
ncbi:MAG TPA: Kae1-associated kinase Bud32 [Nitrososphaerales archaeon]|nr:Kae1-associated kinase Bud32 [Nitrososphaerales archaeon]